MIIVSHPFTSPAFNLAAEEYFLCRRRENAVMLWRNEPSIIIGRNQNAYAELDMDYVKANGIKVIRRLTGGGAVFHDLGNLNFTTIKNGGEGLADFQRALEPVIGYLRSLGLNAEFSGRNDILLDGMKISGSAQVNERGRVMLHGTLLFAAALDTLSAALKPNPLKLKAKGIKSVRSRVTNISAHLEKPMSVADFTAGLYDWFRTGGGFEPYDLTREDIAEIEELVREKYGAFAWNIGSAPPYELEKSALFPGGIVTANFRVKNGRVERVRLYGDFFGARPVSELEERLAGVTYEQGEVARALVEAGVEEYMAGVAAEGLAEIFF